LPAQDLYRYKEKYLMIQNPKARPQPYLENISISQLPYSFLCNHAIQPAELLPERKLLVCLHSYPLLFCMNLSLKVPVTLQAELSCGTQKGKAPSSDTFGQSICSTHSHIWHV